MPISEYKISTLEELIKKYGVNGISLTIDDMTNNPDKYVILPEEDKNIIREMAKDLRDVLILYQLQTDQGILINEGGIGYAKFTRIRLNPDQTVTILQRYKKYRTEEWTDEEKNAITHEGYYDTDIWELTDKIATKYNIPGIGWRIVVNPMDISV